MGDESVLTSVDRVQVVVADGRAATAAYVRLLGAELVREDRVRLLAARRRVLALGASEVELLEADGAGPVADFLSATAGGLFAAGFATPDVALLKTHLRAKGATVAEEGGQLFLSPGAPLPGLRAVISAAATRVAVGLIRHLYEVTLLVDDAASVVAGAATTFNLAPAHFVPIRSEEFGYAGTLTLFHPDRLDRIEVITPSAAAKTMGRFFAKRGPSLYMCYAQAEDLRVIGERLAEHAPRDWTNAGVPDNLFIHPKALGGLMMGVSRMTFAWTWSGHPERVVAGAHA